MNEPQATVVTSGPFTPLRLVGIATAVVLSCFAVLAAAVYGDLAILRRADEVASTAFYDLGAGNAGLVAAMSWITLLGNRWLWVAGGGALAAFLFWRRHWTGGTLVALTCLTPGLAPLIGAMVRRERPVAGLIEADGFGFPSGHALTIAVMATTLVILTWPYLRRRGRVWSLTGAGLAVLLVGATRVGLVVHYPSDVLGGWLLGIGTVLFVLLLVDTVRRSVAGVSASR